MATREDASVIVTIDTEADNLWADSSGRGLSNILRLHESHQFLVELGLRPTYLVAHEVLVDERACSIVAELAQLPTCEVGAHLHAWLTPPVYPPLDSSGGQPFLHEYPEDLRLAKLSSVTAAVADCAGKPPTSYRGGRWSMDAHTMRALDTMGYLADSTVTPFISWAAMRGVKACGIDYLGAPSQPYHPAADDPLKPGALAIVEVPASSRPAGLLPPALFSGLASHVRAGQGPRRSFSRRLLNRLAPVVMPNPARTPARQLRRVVERIVQERAAVLNLSIHSSELTAGGAPWVQTSEDEKRVWAAFGEVVEWLGELAPWRAVTLTEFARTWTAREGRGPAPGVA